MRCIIGSALQGLCLIGFLAAAAGCNGGGAGLRETDKHLSYSADGKTMVVVIDVSGSMNQTDPDRATVEGTFLISGLVETGDNVATVSFSSDARVISKLRTIRTPADRRQLCAEIGRVRREGSTNFLAPLKRAREILEDVNAPAGSTVFFMTDGEHNTGGTPAQVLQEVKAFRDRGWKIQALGYSPEAKTELLSELATRTGGGFYHATTAKQLLIDYIKISGELEDILVAPEIRPVRMFPGTTRLLYVVLKGDPTTRFATLQRDGKPVPFETPTTFHYPAEGERSRSFDVLRIENPEAGRWDGAVQGPYEVGMILQKAPFEFEIAPGSPKREQVDGRPVQVTLFVKGDAVDQIADASAVTASVTSFDGRQIASLNLARTAAPGPKMLAFSGEFTPHLKDPKVPETHTISLRFTWRDGDVIWTHDRTVSYKLVPPPAAAIEVEPAEVDLGTVFAGDAAKTAEVTVRASGAAAKRVTATPQGAVSANPGELTDVPQGGAKVRISAAPDAPGEFRASVLFKPSEGGDDASTATVLVKAKVVNLKAPAAVALGDVMAGETASAPVQITGDDPRVELPALAGPKGGALPMTLDGGKLTVPIPRNAAPGKYEGTIDVTVGGATRRIPVTLNVTPPEARIAGLPPKVAFANTKKSGQLPEQASDLQLDAAEPCSVTLAWTELAPAGGKGRAIPKDKVKVALEGADGGKFTPGAPVKLKTSVYVGGDVPPGDYAGKAIVTLQSPDGKKSVKEFPIELTVTR